MANEIPLKNYFGAFFALCICVFFLSPLQLYFMGISEFWFSLSQLLPVILSVTFFAVSALFTLAWILKRNSIFYISIVAFLLCWYLQGTYLNPSFGALDGVAIDWSKHIFMLILSSLVWLLVFVIFFLFLKENYKVHFFVLVFIVVSQLTSVVVMAGRPNSGVGDKYGFQVTSASLFEVSSNKNIFYFVLDAFDAEVMDQLVKENSEILHFFSDFTWFPDTVAGATRTKLAIPFMLSNKPYLSPLSYSDYKRDSFLSSSLLSSLKANGYDFSIYTSSTYLPSVASDYSNNVYSKRPVVSSGQDLGEVFYKYVGFVYLPQILKKYFWLYSGDFDEIKASSVDGLGSYRINDAELLQAIEEAQWSVSSKNVMKFVHLMGPHAPYTLSEFGKRVELGESSEIIQAKGSLYVVSRYLKYLKEIGAYGNSTIVITADHGLRGIEQNPLLMVKSVGDESETLQISHSSSSHAVLYKCLVAGINKDSKSLTACIEENSDQKRYFYQQSDSNNKVNIIEYVTTGHASDLDSFMRTGVVGHANTGKTSYYKIGDVLDFMSDGTGNAYAVSGLSKNEGSHTWTSSPLVRFVLPLEEGTLDTSSLLSLGLDFGTFGSVQHLNIKINSKSIFEGSVQATNGVRNFLFPKSLISGTEIVLDFELPDAASPHSIGMSDDHRLLGLALKTMIFSEQNSNALFQGRLVFNNQETSYNVAVSGWSHPEPTHRWTDGSKATLQLPLDQSELNPNTALRLRMQANGFSPQGKDHQPVTVMVNGTEVAQWQLRGVEWHEAIIPAEVAAKQWPLQVDFLIAEPTAPCEVSDSRDCRKLGMAARELVLEAVESGQ